MQLGRPSVTRRASLALAAVLIPLSLGAGAVAPAHADEPGPQAGAVFTLSPTAGEIADINDWVSLEDYGTGAGWSDTDVPVDVRSNLACGDGLTVRPFLTEPGTELPAVDGSSSMRNLYDHVSAGNVGSDASGVDQSRLYLAYRAKNWTKKGVSTLAPLDALLPVNHTYSFGLVCIASGLTPLVGADGHPVAVWGTLTTDASGGYSFAQAAQETQLGITAVPAGPAEALLTATVSANGVTATGAGGSVEFFEGATSLGIADVESGVATLDKTGWTPGPHTVRAVYTPAEGSPFSGSETTSSATVQVPDKDPTTISLTGSATTTSATVRATIAPSDATGTVTFTRNGLQLGGPVAVVSGTATLSDTGLAAGTSYSYAAHYSGSQTHRAADSVSPLSITTAKNGSSVTLSGTATQNSALITATVAPGESGGTVTFARNGAPIGNPIAVAGGKATVTDTGLAASTAYAYTATYSGNAATSSSSTITALRLTTAAAPAIRSVSAIKLKVSPSKVIVKKTKAKVSITVTAQGAKPTGTIAISVGGKKVKTVRLTAASKGRVIVSLPAFKRAGKQKVVVTYAGDKLIEPSAKAATVNVRKR